MQRVPGLIIFSLGFIALVIDLVQFTPFSAAPAADFILMGSLMLSGVATLAAGKYSLFVGGLLTLAAWYIWDAAPVPQQYGEGDFLYRAILPILAVLFIVAGVIVAVANRKKRKHK